MNASPDRRYFARIARESGFRAGPLETVYRLAQLLAGIGERFGDELLLRGGTALNLLHLDVPRLSVDIDLDFVGTADAEQARQRRPQLLAEIEALAQATGYEVAQERASYAMAHLRLPYLDADGRPALLKFDVNFLDRVPVLPPVRLAVQHPFGDDLATSTMLTFALPELAATKTIALVRRALARDLFDAAMLATLPDLDGERMRTVLVVRGAGYPLPSPRDYSLDVGPGPGDQLAVRSARSLPPAAARHARRCARSGEGPPPNGDRAGAGSPRVSRSPRTRRAAPRRAARSRAPRPRRGQPRASVALARRGRGARGAIGGRGQGWSRYPISQT